MMTFTSRLISILVGMVILTIISYLIRRRKIYNIYAITWLLLSIFLILIGISTGVTELLGYAIGVDFTPIAILVIIIGGMFTILIHLSMIVSGQHQELKRLEKEISLLKVSKPK